ncbi:HEAT repeat domain-containing protein [candidate division KSB1 bacterium]|nr:HEAT repeat domain-containing protein [candidate division KSB1 bacterium]
MEALIHTREEFLLLEQRIIEALEKMGDPRAVPVLVELAQDERKDLSVRLVAMETLGMIGNEVALQGLLELMKDPRNYIFYNVVEESVIKIGGDRGLEALRQTVAGVQEAMSRKTE